MNMIDARAGEPVFATSVGVSMPKTAFDAAILRKHALRIEQTSLEEVERSRVFRSKRAVHR
jgi:hypothetical protein